MGRLYFIICSAFVTCGLSLDLVWAPTFDQNAQMEVETGQGHLLNHPDFPQDQSNRVSREKIRKSLAVAYAKGFRVIDVQFWLSRAMLQEDYSRDYFAKPMPPVWDPLLSGFAGAGEDWVLEVDNFNRSHDQPPLKLRIRLVARANTIYYILRTVKPYKTFLQNEDPGKGKTRSRFADLPFDACFEVFNPLDSCFQKSPVDKYFYRTLDEEGRLNNTVPNLANPVISKHIGNWAGIVIEEIKKLTSGRTAIEEVSLVLDSGGESGLFGHDAGGVVSFSNRTYKRNASFSDKAAFFQEREGYLKDVYRKFAEAVHAKSNGDSSRIKAGIFSQTHALDGRARGTFDLYSLLKGTGIDILHHTQTPGTYEQSFKWTAFSASIAKQLGIEFDTEFSWAHYSAPKPLHWKRTYLSDQNAEAFYGQARSGIGLGAVAVVFANWTMHEIINPPKTDKWRKIIGTGPSAYSSRHLTNQDGFFSLPRFNSPNTRALYISSLGRMACEEKKATGMGNDRLCNWLTYLEWLDEFGFRSEGLDRSASQKEGMTILTDGMILANPSMLSQFKKIYVPFETSTKTESRVYDILRHLTGTDRAKFKFQTSEKDSGSGSFEDWISSTQRITLPNFP